MMHTRGAARGVGEPGATSEPGIGLAERFSRIGIQTRIMLYVTVGLVTMFGGFAYLGFRAVGDATQLVYEERLSTAYTTASIIERDFVHIARDADEVFADVETRAAGRVRPAAARLGGPRGGARAGRGGRGGGGGRGGRGAGRPVRDGLPPGGRRPRRARRPGDRRRRAA